MVTFEVVTFIPIDIKPYRWVLQTEYDEPEPEENRLYGACFQNGKLLDTEVVSSFSLIVTELTGNVNRVHIRNEILNVDPEIEALFYIHYQPFNENQLELVRKWNSYYLNTYRSALQYIPLRTIGGENRLKLLRKKYPLLTLILFALIGILIAFLVYAIYDRCTINETSINERY